MFLELLVGVISSHTFSKFYQENEKWYILKHDFSFFFFFFFNYYN